MLRCGLIGLALSAGCALLLTLLSMAGAAHFGPCGPDAPGVIFLIGFLSTGSLGILLTAAALWQRGIKRLRH
jgi:hypothetical protein